MYLDIRNENMIIVDNVPKNHIFSASSCLSEPIEDGCTTGDFQHFGQCYHISEGFLPLAIGEQPGFDPFTQRLQQLPPVISDDGKNASISWEVIALSGEEVSNNLAGLKADKKRQAELKRSSLLLTGFSYLDKNFACDREAKVNMMIQYQAFQINESFPEDFGWKAIGEDELTPMTEAQFKELIKQAGLYCSQVYTTSFNLKKQVDELTSIDDVTNFIINFG